MIHERLVPDWESPVTAAHVPGISDCPTFFIRHDFTGQQKGNDSDVFGTWRLRHDKFDIRGRCRQLKGYTRDTSIVNSSKMIALSGSLSYGLIG